MNTNPDLMNETLAVTSATLPTRQPTTIDKMLDSVEWKRCVAPVENPEGLPFPTHEGILKIGSLELECYILNDGRRIFSGESVDKFWKCLNMPVDVRRLSHGVDPTTAQH